MIELLNDQGPVPAPNIFILGIYIVLGDSEVICKQKELFVETMRGDPGAKIEYMVMDNTSHRAGSRQMLGWGFRV